MEIEVDDWLFRIRVRQTIQRGGGPLAVANKTGIPLSTVNKYVAMTSTASFTNAAKIAEAAGLTLDRLAYGIDGRGAALDILSEVFQMLVEVHEENEIVLPPLSLARLADEHYEAIRRNTINVGDKDEILGWVHTKRQEVLLELMSAIDNPGSGKRSAS